MVNFAVLGQQLDSKTLEIFSNLNVSIIQFLQLLPGSDLLLSSSSQGQVQPSPKSPLPLGICQRQWASGLWPEHPLSFSMALLPGSLAARLAQSRSAFCQVLNWFG